MLELAHKDYGKTAWPQLFNSGIDLASKGFPISDDPELVGRRRVLGDVEYVIAILAQLLGEVHGLIGVAHEQVGIRAVTRIKGDADAGGYLQCVAIDHERPRGGVQQSFQNRVAIVAVIEIDQHQVLKR